MTTGEGVSTTRHELVSIELDRLVGSLMGWETFRRYYLGSLLPSQVSAAEINAAAASSVVESPHPLNKEEREAQFVSSLTSLRLLLPEDEWKSIPELIRRREEEKERLRAREQALEQEKRAQKAQRLTEALTLARHAAEQKRESEREHVIAAVKRSMAESFLVTERVWRAHPNCDALEEADVESLMRDFVQGWAETRGGLGLDSQQAAAVAATGCDVKVVARAGSGKTRTLVTKALFLQKHCKVPPPSLLLLAFNRNAADEMRERLRSHLGDSLPHVMTFHALAYALVHPDEDMVYDEPASGNELQSREIQEAIDEHLRSTDFRRVIQDIMLSHFRDDWDSITRGGYDRSVEDFVEFRRSQARETLGGQFVKSYGERLIANTLFENDIAYGYEWSHRWDGTVYRPDFTIKVPGRDTVIIEYFGLRGDRDYDEQAARKRDYWESKKGFRLLERTPRDITSRGEDHFRAALLDELRGLGLTPRALPLDELWGRIERRSIDKFTRAVRTFVTKCRKENLSPELLDARVAAHRPISNAERLFVGVAASVHREYLSRLHVGNKLDFDGLLWQAVDRVQSGQGAFLRDKGRERGNLRNLQYVLIDEFQDFSRGFAALTHGIRQLTPSVKYFCVGDDWQAINGFAGSDLSYFMDFASVSGSSRTLHVRTNYRSAEAIVEVGNALMTGRGEGALPRANAPAGCVRLGRLAEFTPSVAEEQHHGRDTSTPALLRLVKQLLTSSRDVVLLAHTNGQPWDVQPLAGSRRPVDTLERFAEHVRAHFQKGDRERIRVSTTHKFKGLEGTAVIVLDADAQRYPLIHPHWSFTRIFGDSIAKIEVEERRLFYVALTRATNSLVLLSSSGESVSPFVEDLLHRMPLETIDWNKVPQGPVPGGEKVHILVRTPHAVPDRIRQLRAQGFSWRDPCWRRLDDAQGFDFARILEQDWATEDVAIEIRSAAGERIEGRDAVSGDSANWFAQHGHRVQPVVEPQRHIEMP